MISDKIYNLSVNILKRSSLGALAEKRVCEIIEFPEPSYKEENQKVPISLESIIELQEFLASYITDNEILALKILAYLCDQEQMKRYKLYGLEKHVVCSSVYNVTRAMGMELKTFYSCLNVAYPYYLSILRSCYESQENDG